MKDEKELPKAPENAPNIEMGAVRQFPKEHVEIDAQLTRQFAAYAAPLSWGPWAQIASHGGVVTYNIGYRAIGDTLVHGAVNYYGPNGWVTQVFRDSISIRTGNAWANVLVCFHGNPFGSTVHGTINP